METTIRDNVIEIIRRNLGIPNNKEILESHDLVYDLGADSLDLLQIQMLLECEFNIELPDDKFVTTQDLTIKYIIDCIQAENIDLDVNSIDDSLISLEDCVYGSESTNLALELAKFIHNTCSSVPHDIGLRLIQEIKIFYEKRLDGYIENKKEEDSIENNDKSIQIDLSDDVFMTIAKEAHERDITFNDMVNIILKESIDEK